MIRSCFYSHSEWTGNATTGTNIVRENALHHEQSLRVYPRFSELNALCTPTERQANRWEMSAEEDDIDYIVAEDTGRSWKHYLIY
jgi:hypothetical protein